MATCFKPAISPIHSPLDLVKEMRVLFYSPVYEAYRSDRVRYPYIKTLGGLEVLNGMPAYVKLVK